VTVDGQQRVTTLIIILKAISELLLKSPDKKESEKGKDIYKLLVKSDNRIILLQTNHDSSLIFNDYIIHYKIPNVDNLKTQAELNLYNAFHETEIFLKKWKSKYSIIELFKLIQYRLGFLFYSLTDEGIVYSTFEVLNSRGLTVDWLDKTKSIIMGVIFEKFKPKIASEYYSESHKIWTQIYEIIGMKNVSGDEIIRFAATLKSSNEISRTLSAEEALKYFRDYSSNNPKEIIDIEYFILDVAKKLK